MTDISPYDLLKVQDDRALQAFLVNEVQEVSGEARARVEALKQATKSVLFVCRFHRARSQGYDPPRSAGRPEQ